MESAHIHFEEREGEGLRKVVGSKIIERIMASPLATHSMLRKALVYVKGLKNIKKNEIRTKLEECYIFGKRGVSDSVIGQQCQSSSQYCSLEVYETIAEGIHH